jgi:hypothetical protein
MPTATSIRTLNSRPGERAIRNACEH